MINDTEPHIVDKVRSLRSEGKTHAEVLRWLAGHNFSPIDMMYHIAEAFDLHPSEVSCVNGWWHDDTGELKDNDINRLIDEALAKKVNS